MTSQKSNKKGQSTCNINIASDYKFGAIKLTIVAQMIG